MPGKPAKTTFLGHGRRTGAHGDEVAPPPHTVLVKDRCVDQRLHSCSVLQHEVPSPQSVQQNLGRCFQGSPKTNQLTQNSQSLGSSLTSPLVPGSTRYQT